MTCFDSCCTDADERIPAIMLSQRVVKAARRQHRCSGCLHPIEIGSGYWREFWLVDGEPTTVTRHGYCLTY